MVRFVRFENAAHPLPYPFVSIDSILAEVEYLRAQSNGICNVTLHKPAQLPIILVITAGIAPVAASPICRPWSAAFLNPYRKEERNKAISEVAIAVASRDMHNREDAHLR